MNCLNCVKATICESCKKQMCEVVEINKLGFEKPVGEMCRVKDHYIFNGNTHCSPCVRKLWNKINA